MEQLLFTKVDEINLEILVEREIYDGT